MAIKEKMEKMQLAFRKVKGWIIVSTTCVDLSSKVPIALPPKFKIPNAENFGGIGDPK